jgi:hypothetical protein
MLCRKIWYAIPRDTGWPQNDISDLFASQRLHEHGGPKHHEIALAGVADINRARLQVELGNRR